MLRHDLSIAELSAVLDTSIPNVSRWIRGIVLPPAADLIVKFLEIDDKE